MDTRDIFLLVVLAIVNAPIYVGAFRTMFGSWSSFKDAMWNASRDDYSPFWNWTASSSDRHNNTLAEIMIFLFLAFCVGAVVGEYYLINTVLLGHRPFWN